VSYQLFKFTISNKYGRTVTVLHLTWKKKVAGGGLARTNACAVLS
jgi:hypothetical protein